MDLSIFNIQSGKICPEGVVFLSRYQEDLIWNHKTIFLDIKVDEDSWFRFNET